MAFPEILDFDRIACQALREIGTAVGGWLRGQPHEEVALMNRITEQLSRDRRNCDVGVRVPVAMESKVYELHRKGSEGQDQYGADFAITMSVPESDWIKTALFQMKRSSNTSIVVEKHQIDEAAKDNGIFGRTFVFAVDEQRGLMRLKSACEIQADFPANQKTHTVDCSHWHGLVYWLHQWLGCAIGAESTCDGPEGVEDLLASYVIEPTPSENLGALGAEQREDFLPARLWMKLLFQSISADEGSKSI